MAAAVMGVPARIASIPYDLAYVDAVVRWLRARGGEECWPNHYGLDMLAKNHVYDDARSRRDLSWSPQVGSFDEGVMELVSWFQQRRHLAAVPLHQLLAALDDVLCLVAKEPRGLNVRFQFLLLG